MYSKSSLTEEQKVLYDDLYIKSKELYPDLIEEMYERVICCYILHDLNDEVFEKMLKNKKSCNKEEETTRDNETNEIL